MYEVGLKHEKSKVWEDAASCKNKQPLLVGTEGLEILFLSENTVIQFQLRPAAHVLRVSICLLKLLYGCSGSINIYNYNV